VADGEFANAKTFEQTFETLSPALCSLKPQLPRDLVRVLARRQARASTSCWKACRTVADLGRAFARHLYEAKRAT
jgi:glycerol-3-phosphate dehydrogenase